MKYDKLANTVLYLLEGSAPGRPGSTHLLKMLWYADYLHYRRHLRSITGGEYVAMERGPVLDGYKELFNRLHDDGIVDMRDVPVHGFPDAVKVEYSPLMEPNENGLTDAERATLDEVIRECADKSGNYLSDRTHRDGPWMMVYPVRRNALIPYALFRWMDNTPTESDVAKAKKTLAREHTARALDALQKQAVA